MVYVAAMVVALYLLNEDAQNWRLALTIWGVATIVCGWFASSAYFALLALLAIPISIPFGTAEKWLGSDAPWIPIWATIWGFFSAIAILLLWAAHWIATAPRGSSPIVSKPVVRVGALLVVLAVLVGFGVAVAEARGA